MSQKFWNDAEVVDFLINTIKCGILQIPKVNIKFTQLIDLFTAILTIYPINFKS
jgi:hypothetical protein